MEILRVTHLTFLTTFSLLYVLFTIWLQSECHFDRKNLVAIFFHWWSWGGISFPGRRFEPGPPGWHSGTMSITLLQPTSVTGFLISFCTFQDAVSLYSCSFDPDYFKRSSIFLHVFSFMVQNTDSFLSRRFCHHTNKHFDRKMLTTEVFYLKKKNDGGGQNLISTIANTLIWVRRWSDLWTLQIFYFEKGCKCSTLCLKIR